MTTVVNNPAPQSGGNGSGFLVGAIVLIVVVAIVVFYGIPLVNNMGPVQVNVPAPQVNVETPEIVVPDEIDVNVTPAE